MRSPPRTAERRRIAAYLHDGPVQDIAGVAFSLAPLADERRGAGRRRTDAGVLATAIEQPAPQRPRPAHAARRAPSAAPRGGRARGGDPRPRSARSRHAGIARRVVGRRAPSTSTRRRRRSSTGSRTRRSATSSIMRRRPEVRVDVTRRAGRDAARRRGRRPRLRARPSASGARRRAISACRCSRSSSRQSGGTLDVRSAPGEGTTVELEVPRR